MARVQPWQGVCVTPAGGETVAGRVRIVALTVDVVKRNGLVYVDLPQPGAARAGMFARGEFDIGGSSALTLPPTAVLLRNGFVYAFRVGADNKVAQTKVSVGRCAGERIDIAAGLGADAGRTACSRPRSATFRTRNAGHAAGATSPAR